jgi:hypothetical protein
MIMELGSRRMWPVDRGCLLLLGTWSHLWSFHGSVEAWYFLYYGFFHLLDLDTDLDCGFLLSVYPTWRNDFDSRLLSLANLDTLILTNDFCVSNETHGVYHRLTGDAYSSGISGGPCSPIYIFLWLLISTCVSRRNGINTQNTNESFLPYDFSWPTYILLDWQLNG